MSDISFPRGQQSIADLSAPSQNTAPPPRPEPPPISESSLLDVQAVFVSPRRVVDDGGVQLLFRDSESGEVLRSFPPETASSVYQTQQDNNQRLASSTTTPAPTTLSSVQSSETDPFTPSATPAIGDITPDPVPETAPAPAPATPSASGGSDAGNLTAAALSPNNDQVGIDAPPPADDTEISLASA